MPAKFNRVERLELLVWASGKGFTLEELGYAIERVRDWWETRRQMRAAWPTVVKQAMRNGWALRGFKEEMQRTEQGRTGRAGDFVVKRTKLTEEWIEAWKVRNS